MDIFNFDDEQNILNYLMIHIGQTLLLNGNSFERKLLRCIQNKSVRHSKKQINKINFW